MWHVLLCKKVELHIGEVWTWTPIVIFIYLQCLWIRCLIAKYPKNDTCTLKWTSKEENAWPLKEWSDICHTRKKLLVSQWNTDNHNTVAQNGRLGVGFSTFYTTSITCAQMRYPMLICARSNLGTWIGTLASNGCWAPRVLQMKIVKILKGLTFVLVRVSKAGDHSRGRSGKSSHLTLLYDLNSWQHIIFECSFIFSSSFSALFTNIYLCLFHPIKYNGT